MAKKIYVFDTSVLLTDANSIYSYEKNDILIPLKVLDEIDRHKKRQDGVGLNARNIIRILDSLREKGSLYNGIRLEKGKGILSVRQCENLKKVLPYGLDPTSADNKILAAALSEKKNSKRKVIVVSRDINMRVKCDAIGLIAEDYVENNIVKSENELYTGYTTRTVKDHIIDRFYKEEPVFLEEGQELFSNQFVVLVSNVDEKKTALARFVNKETPLKKIHFFKNGLWGIKPKNKEQIFALNLLMDPKVQIVTLVGKAGSGKTLCAAATALQQVVDTGTDKNFPFPSFKYRKMVISRPIQPMGKDIGYLPGTLKEKMTPWLAPIQDNLEFLMGNDKIMLEEYAEKGIIEVEALTYIRGRSISNSFIIIDETQNLTMHELKTILTRVGEGAKIVLTGDIEQIDNVYVDAISNGLTYAVEKFKYYDIAGHVTLNKGERSKVASLAAQIL